MCDAANHIESVAYAEEVKHKLITEAGEQVKQVLDKCSHKKTKSCFTQRAEDLVFHIEELGKLVANWKIGCQAKSEEGSRQS